MRHYICASVLVILWNENKGELDAAITGGQNVGTKENPISMSGVTLRSEVLPGSFTLETTVEAKWSLWRRRRRRLVLAQPNSSSAEFAEFIKAAAELIRQETDWRRTRKSNWLFGGNLLSRGNCWFARGFPSIAAHFHSGRFGFNWRGTF